MSKPVRVLSEAANVDEAHAFELGTLLQATKHRHNLPLQLRGWEGHPRRQLYSFSSGHRVANDGSGNLVPQPSTGKPGCRRQLKRQTFLFLREIHGWPELKACGRDLAGQPLIPRPDLAQCDPSRGGLAFGKISQKPLSQSHSRWPAPHLKFGTWGKYFELTRQAALRAASNLTK